MRAIYKTNMPKQHMEEKTMSRDIKKDLADYEEKFGGTKSGIHTITCADIMSSVKRNIKGDQVYLPENFDYYEIWLMFLFLIMYCFLYCSSYIFVFLQCSFFILFRYFYF